MPAPDPVAEAITRGLQAMIAKDAPPEEPEPKGFSGFLKRLRHFGKQPPREQ